VFARFILVKIWSASLVQENGTEWSFRWSMKALIAAISSLTGVNEPRRIACRVVIENKHSTKLIHEHLWACAVLA